MNQESRRTTSSATRRHDVEGFAQALAALRKSAMGVLDLGRDRIARGVVEIEQSTPGTAHRILFLMGEIEQAFRAIRKRLAE